MADFYEMLEKSAAPEKGPRPFQAAPVPPPNAAYSELMKRAEAMAERVAKSRTGERLTVEQCFEKVFSAPENSELAMAALGKGKRPTAAGRFPPKGKPNVDPDDDDDLDGSDTDDDVNDATDRSHDGIGTPPFEGASGSGRGRSTDYSGAPYSDGDNLWQTPKPVAVGDVELGYNDKARPKSAFRKIQKRIRKALKRQARERQVAAG